MKISLSVAIGLLTVSLILGCEKSTTTGPASSTAAPNRTTGAPALKKLTLVALKNQIIKQGETDEVLVTITRDNFDDAVAIGFDHLPPGVTLVESGPSIAKGEMTKTVTLKAADDAAVGETDVTLFAQAPGVDKNTLVFKLTVNKK